MKYNSRKYEVTKDIIFYDGNYIDRKDFEYFITEKGYLESCEDCFNPSSLYGHYQIESSISMEDLYKTDMTSILNDYLENLKENQ